MKEYKKKINHNNAFCHLLVKIGKKEHMETLIKHGEVYMNTTQYFQTHTNPEIGDTFEGALFVKNGQVSEYRVNIQYEKLFCLWHINDIKPIFEDIIYSSSYDEKNNQTTFTLDFRKLSGFTDDKDTYMVVIFNVKEFNRRFQDACKKNKVKFINNCIVSYYDQLSINPNREITPFMKREKYKKQQEIRYLVIKEDNNPLKISLGSLNDIARMCNVNDECLKIVGTTK